MSFGNGSELTSLPVGECAQQAKEEGSSSTSSIDQTTATIEAARATGEKGGADAIADAAAPCSSSVVVLGQVDGNNGEITMNEPADGVPTPSLAEAVASAAGARASDGGGDNVAPSPSGNKSSSKSHPPYRDMALRALLALSDKKGSSLVAIDKVVRSMWPCVRADKSQRLVGAALKELVRAEKAEKIRASFRVSSKFRSDMAAEKRKKAAQVKAKVRAKERLRQKETARKDREREWGRELTECFNEREGGNPRHRRGSMSTRTRQLLEKIRQRRNAPMEDLQLVAHLRENEDGQGLTVCPAPDAAPFPGVSAESIGDLLSVCSFCDDFRSLIGTSLPEFTSQQLYEAVSGVGGSAVDDGDGDGAAAAAAASSPVGDDAAATASVGHEALLSQLFWALLRQLMAPWDDDVNPATDADADAHVSQESKDETDSAMLPSDASASASTAVGRKIGTRMPWRNSLQWGSLLSAVTWPDLLRRFLYCQFAEEWREARPLWDSGCYVAGDRQFSPGMEEKGGGVILFGGSITAVTGADRPSVTCIRAANALTRCMHGDDGARGPSSSASSPIFMGMAADEVLAALRCVCDAVLTTARVGRHMTRLVETRLAAEKDHRIAAKEELRLQRAILAIEKSEKFIHDNEERKNAREKAKADDLERNAAIKAAGRSVFADVKAKAAAAAAAAATAASLEDERMADAGAEDVASTPDAAGASAIPPMDDGDCSEEVNDANFSAPPSDSAAGANFSDRSMDDAMVLDESADVMSESELENDEKPPDMNDGEIYAPGAGGEGDDDAEDEDEEDGEDNMEEEEEEDGDDDDDDGDHDDAADSADYDGVCGNGEPGTPMAEVAKEEGGTNATTVVADVHTRLADLASRKSTLQPQIEVATAARQRCDDKLKLAQTKCVGTRVLGWDRHWNRYWAFSCDPQRIYCETRHDQRWGCFDGLDQVRSLYAGLLKRGLRESKLLKAIAPNLDALEAESSAAASACVQADSAEPASKERGVATDEASSNVDSADGADSDLAERVNNDAIQWDDFNAESTRRVSSRVRRKQEADRAAAEAARKEAEVIRLDELAAQKRAAEEPQAFSWWRVDTVSELAVSTDAAIVFLRETLLAAEGLTTDAARSLVAAQKSKPSLLADGTLWLWRHESPACRWCMGGSKAPSSLWRKKLRSSSSVKCTDLAPLMLELDNILYDLTGIAEQRRRDAKRLAVEREKLMGGGGLSGRMRERIFFETVAWPELERQGWSIECVNETGREYIFYMPPGVSRARGRFRVEYFDTRRQVLNFAKKEDLISDWSGSGEFAGSVVALHDDTDSPMNVDDCFSENSGGANSPAPSSSGLVADATHAPKEEDSNEEINTEAIADADNVATDAASAPKEEVKADAAMDTTCLVAAVASALMEEDAAAGTNDAVAGAAPAPEEEEEEEIKAEAAVDNGGEVADTVRIPKQEETAMEIDATAVTDDEVADAAPVPEVEKETAEVGTGATANGHGVTPAAEETAEEMAIDQGGETPSANVVKAETIEEVADTSERPANMNANVNGSGTDAGDGASSMAEAACEPPAVVAMPKLSEASAMDILGQNRLSLANTAILQQHLAQQWELLRQHTPNLAGAGVSVPPLLAGLLPNLALRNCGLPSGALGMPFHGASQAVSPQTAAFPVTSSPPFLSSPALAQQRQFMAPMPWDDENPPPPEATSSAAAGGGGGGGGGKGKPAIVGLKRNDPPSGSESAGPTPPPRKRRRNVRCGGCSACTTPDCGKCRSCIDKPKFGGSNSLKRACTSRGPCETPKNPKTSRANPKAKSKSKSASKPQLDADGKVVVGIAGDDAKAEPKKVKKPKDPYEPKRPSSAYMYYNRLMHPKIQAEHTDWSFKQVATASGAKWKSYTAEEKKCHHDKAAEDKARYLEEMREYKENPQIRIDRINKEIEAKRALRAAKRPPPKPKPAKKNKPPSRKAARDGKGKGKSPTETAPEQMPQEPRVKLADLKFESWAEGEAAAGADDVALGDDEREEAVDMGNWLPLVLSGPASSHNEAHRRWREEVAACGNGPGGDQTLACMSVLALILFQRTHEALELHAAMRARAEEALFG